MPRSYRGHKYVLCVIDEVMNYLIMVPIYQSKSEETGDGLIETCYNKELCTRIHNNGSRWCIYVFSYELCYLRSKILK